MAAYFMCKAVPAMLDVWCLISVCRQVFATSQQYDVRTHLALHVLPQVLGRETVLRELDRLPHAPMEAETCCLFC